MTMAICVGVWQMCNQAAMVVQILFATRKLGLSERGVGLSYVALGAGTVAASALGYRVVRRLGPGPTLVLGFAISGGGWLVLAAAPLNRIGVAGYAFMLLSFGVGAVFIFINFLSLRQSVTPASMLGRMTSTMRWLILLPAGPGALLGGWLGEHVGLRTALGFAGVTALALSARCFPAQSRAQREDASHAQGGGHYAIFIGQDRSAERVRVKRPSAAAKMRSSPTDAANGVNRASKPGVVPLRWSWLSFVLQETCK